MDIPGGIEISQERISNGQCIECGDDIPDDIRYEPSVFRCRNCQVKFRLARAKIKHLTGRWDQELKDSYRDRFPDKDDY